MKTYTVFYCHLDFEERSFTSHYKAFRANSPTQAMYRARREMMRALKLPESALWQITAYVCIVGKQENLRDKVEGLRLARALSERRQHVRSA